MEVDEAKADSPKKSPAGENGEVEAKESEEENEEEMKEEKTDTDKDDKVNKPGCTVKFFNKHIGTNVILCKKL